ncbi:MAG: hypothetical protein QM539_03270 [Alphaproteobacteria bacterium]|nr:hypothetical protein [Alphaproteobacteria bacterium]
MTFKKYFYGVLIIFVLGWVVGYLILPNQLKVSTVAILKTPHQAIKRNLDSVTLTTLFKNNKDLTLTNINPFSANFEVIDLTLNKNYKIKLIELNQDSMLLVISYTYPKTYSILSKIRNITQGNQLKKRQNIIKSILLNKYNSIFGLYGMTIINDSVKHYLYISSRKTFKFQPSTRDIYHLISTLETFIKKEGGNILSPPMVYNQNDYKNKQFFTMVAMATDIVIRNSPQFYLKTMVRGKLLKAKIVGGGFKVWEQQKQLDYFVKDNNLISPAIPFAMFLTNRMEQPDSNKWVTEIYYPIY